LDEWRKFIKEYGHRCTRELDIASQRYKQDPEPLLRQVALLSNDRNAGESPLDVLKRSRDMRQEAYSRLVASIREEGRDPGQFIALYKTMEAVGGLRETHKFYVIYAFEILRERLLEETKPLVYSGRLDYEEQIFGLEFEDFEKALTDDSVDLRELIKERTAFTDTIVKLPRLPKLIDSRGRIFRAAPPQAREGEIAGFPVSPGIARGRIKTLNEPDEKPLNPGEIMVARATDPGWTPLFVNAAAVILEVGGMLQHGALVAREYGKPCVAGVDNAVSLFTDGEMVEVDGASGIIRKMDKDQAAD